MTPTTIRRTLTGLLFVSAAATVAALSPSRADANGSAPACASRDMVVKTLHRDYGEQRHNLMLDVTGNLVEMFSNLKTGSWTLTITVPGGPTCIMSSGGNFVQETRTAALGEQGS